ncbi:hypothetical protein AX16_006963 [Volvariella volvacea WC 439]|nr:hypothetical protein AX16_006963 [Volvariella volvacea WC 439]
MIRSLFEVTTIGTGYILLGGFVTVFSLFTVLLKEQLFLNEVILGTLFGFLVGPHGFNLFDPRSWTSSPSLGLSAQNAHFSSHTTHIITHEVMRIVLATGLFAIGVELPKSYMARHVRGMVALVVPTMAIGWMLVSGMIKILVPILDFPSCLAIAACLTPTDPVICSSIVGGKFAKDNVPLRLRHVLSAESAANDGLAYPFLAISMILVLRAPTSSNLDILADWLLVGWLYQVVLGTLTGALIGIVFSRIMTRYYKSGYMNQDTYLIQYLALSIFTVGIVSTMGSDDLLAAFAAGSAISWDGKFNDRIGEDQTFSHILDFILNCFCFIYIGAWMPFHAFFPTISHTDFLVDPQLGLTTTKLLCILIGILLLRRIPALLVLYTWVPEIEGWKEALFTGHFGPMGVGALFMATMALKELPPARMGFVPSHTTAQPTQNEQHQLLAQSLEVIVAFVILGSIFVHGLSTTIYTIFLKIQDRLNQRYHLRNDSQVGEVAHAAPTATSRTTGHNTRSANASNTSTAQPTSAFSPADREFLLWVARPKSYGSLRNAGYPNLFHEALMRAAEALGTSQGNNTIGDPNGGHNTTGDLHK